MIRVPFIIGVQECNEISPPCLQPVDAGVAGGTRPAVGLAHAVPGDLPGVCERSYLGGGRYRRLIVDDDYFQVDSVGKILRANTVKRAPECLLTLVKQHLPETHSCSYLN